MTVVQQLLDIKCIFKSEGTYKRLWWNMKNDGRLERVLEEPPGLFFQGSTNRLPSEGSTAPNFVSTLFHKFHFPVEIISPDVEKLEHHWHRPIVMCPWRLASTLVCAAPSASLPGLNGQISAPMRDKTLQRRAEKEKATKAVWQSRSRCISRCRAF